MSIKSTWIKVFPNGNVYLLNGGVGRDEGILKFQTDKETTKFENALNEINRRGYPKPRTYTIGTPEEEADIIMLPPLPPLNEFSIDSNLKERISPLTIEKIDQYFQDKDCHLQGIGSEVMQASQTYGINPTYIVAHAIHETGWGTSTIYLEKKNLFGYGAYDDNPYGGAKGFSSREECIDYVMKRVNQNYLTPGGSYFSQAPCLGNKSYGMNVYYASDHEWGVKIARHARDIERWTVGSMLGPAQRILDAVNRVNPVQEYYLPHDITGDQTAETFCNWFVADVLDQLGVDLPRYDSDAGYYPRPHPTYSNELKTKPKGADHLYKYFKEGGNGKWREVSNFEAVTIANQGRIAVVSIPGHIALVIPGGVGSEVRIAQAGKRCGKNMSLGEGFGNRTVCFFAYIS